ncbi:hypothetical protein [Microbacterium xylanilyticum]
MIDGVVAAQWLLNQTDITPSRCLYWVWLAYKAQGASTGLSAGTAYEAWQLSRGQRPGDRNPPAGAAVWWGRRHSDGNLDGDVVISIGGGRVAATDYPGWRETGTCTLDEREEQIGREYLGWTSSIFDCPISLPDVGKDSIPAAAAADPSEEDDMKEIYVWWLDDKGQQQNLIYTPSGYGEQWSSADGAYNTAVAGAHNLAGSPAKISASHAAVVLASLAAVRPGKA